MKLSLFENQKNVLLVGEGNFSFAVTLAKHNLNINLTATCYEKNVLETGKKNIEILKAMGIRVFCEVDATKLEEHAILKLENFDIIVFNFPHVGGKMRIEKNRELLKKFFISVKSILSKEGKILMSLCNGQGGTLADNPCRNWNDSWKAVEMAAHGSFILVGIEPFDSSIFQTYTVTGYRSLEKQFHTQGSLTHIFQLVDEPNIHNIAPKEKMELSMMHEETVNWKDFIKQLPSSKTKIESCINESFNQHCYKFDITFSVNSLFRPVKLYLVLYNFAGLLINYVEYIGSYKFPNLKETQTYRITYKSNKFPLHRKLVVLIHNEVVRSIIENNLNVIVTR